MLKFKSRYCPKCEEKSLNKYCFFCSTYQCVPCYGSVCLNINPNCKKFMKKTLLIKSKNEKNFISSVDGQEIKYYWYKAEDTKTEITYNFGSQKAYSVGEVVEVELEKTEGLKGFIYKEPSVS